MRHIFRRISPEALEAAAITLAIGCLVLLALPAHCQQSPPDAPSPRAEARAFWVVAGIDYAAAFADVAVASRSHFAPGIGHCHEANTLYGAPFPSTRRLWLSGAATTTGVVALAWLLKRGHHEWFVVLPLIDAVTHTVAAAGTAQRCLP